MAEPKQRQGRCREENGGEEERHSERLAALLEDVVVMAGLNRVGGPALGLLLLSLVGFVLVPLTTVVERAMAASTETSGPE